jgi:hypothetical protein
MDVIEVGEHCVGSMLITLYLFSAKELRDLLPKFVGSKLCTSRKAGG